MEAIEKHRKHFTKIVIRKLYLTFAQENLCKASIVCNSSPHRPWYIPKQDSTAFRGNDGKW